VSEVNPLPNGWVRASVRDVLAPPTGWNPGGAETATIKYVDIEAVDNKRQRIGAPKEIPISGLPSRARVGIKSGDVLFSLVRPYLKNIARVPQDLDGHVASTAFVSLRPASGMHTDFLFYQLTQDNFIKAIPTYGNSPPAARDEEFLDMQIPVAPPAEQQRIAAKIEELLSDLDAGVSALEHSRANLKRYRAAVLKAAVEGRLTEKWRAAHPGVETAEKLLERILAERRKKWEEAQLKKFAEKKQAPPKGWKDKYSEPVKPDVAELPKLPEGWCWASWSEIGLSQNGRPFPSKEYSDIGAKLLRPGNLYATGAVGWTQKNTKCLPESYALENPDLIVGGGELVMNLTAQSLKDEFLGRICITANDERCLLNQRLARLTPILISPQFILWLFKSAHFRKFVAGLNAGSLIQHMFTSQLEEFVLPLPPIEEQSAIVLETGRLLSICDAVEVQMNRDGYRSARLRQAILKRAFEGKLVPQDPKDEPAGELLARIRAERTDQVAAGRGRGKIRKKIRQKTRK